MTTYNVFVGVIDLIDADTPLAAIEILRTRLMDAGFEVHDEHNDAFESEQL
jgi:hypothetical protein